MTATEPRRVLIATISLVSANGTDIYTRDLALALLARGWLPIVYTTLAGTYADELRRATIPVITDITAVGDAPDIIHGQHYLETLTALTRFPGVPALFVCHDGLTWHSIPPPVPRIRAYVAVDRHCRDRMVFEHGIAADSIQVLTNPVSVRRLVRRPPLPASPQRALVFSNAASENTWVVPIRAACQRRGISLDIIGHASGRVADRPEDVLPRYDLVFAKARCALEAAAVGAAVIVCDARGLAGMLTTQRLEALRQLNFGVRTLRLPITADTILREIDLYDVADAAAVCDAVRKSADIDLLAQQLIEIYEEVIHSGCPTSRDEDIAALPGALAKLTRALYGSPTGRRPGTAARLRSALLNSRPLSLPVHLMYRLKKRLRL